MPLVATMTCESKQRKTEWLHNGCNAFDKKNPSSQPMSFWTEQDVLKFIVRYDLPYPSVYGEIKQNIILQDIVVQAVCFVRMGVT